MDGTVTKQEACTHILKFRCAMLYIFILSFCSTVCYMLLASYMNYHFSKSQENNKDRFIPKLIEIKKTDNAHF